MLQNNFYVSLSVVIRYLNPHLWYRYHDIYYARNDYKSSGLVLNFLETDPRFN